MRLLDDNHIDKTDTHDARSTAIVALRNRRLRHVSLEDHTAVRGIRITQRDGARCLVLDGRISG